MDNFSPVKSPKKKYSSAIIAVIVCAAIVAGAVAIAILNPEGGFDILPSLTGDSRQKTHFTDMKYTRPDTESLINNLDELIGMINSGKSFTEQRSLYNKININYSGFLTMLNLAYVNYSADTSNEFYSEELSLLEKASVTVSNKLNLLHDTIASSSFKTNYERSYYGVGYFTDWKNLVYSDEVEALMEHENELIESYRELMSDPFVEIDGKTIHLNENLNSLSGSEYSAVLRAYYEKYNTLAGEIYVNMVKTRLSIAEKLEKSYIEYSYEIMGRDYTPDEARKYLDSISETIIPAIENIEYDPTPFYDQLDPSASFYAVSHGANSMNGVIEEAFDFMFEMGLYDIGYSPAKSGSSFTTFLYDYNAPYLFATPNCTASDFFTFAHEFGHFVDGYRNMTMDISIDAAEISSRAMEYIMPYYTNALRGYTHEDLTKYSIYTAAEIYTVQGYISSFEHEVYSLPADEITIEKLNSIAYDCATKFGLSEAADIYKYAWIDISHIFEVPFYTVSYIVANDVALQILEAELAAPGKGGVDAFVKSIDRDDDLTFIEEISASGFKSPFSEGRVLKIASIIEDILTEPEPPVEPDSTETIPSETTSTENTPTETLPTEALAIPAA